MEEIFVQLFDSKHPIQVNLASTTFLYLIDEIQNIYLGYPMDALRNHFQSIFGNLEETLQSRSIIGNHIFQLPDCEHPIIYR